MLTHKVQHTQTTCTHHTLQHTHAIQTHTHDTHTHTHARTHTDTHARTHAHTHTQTLTSYMKMVLRNQAHTWFNSFHVILSTHNILVSLFPILVMHHICKATKYTSILQSICMPRCHLTTLTIIHLIHHPKGWAECCTYVHMFVIYNVQSTV